MDKLIRKWGLDVLINKGLLPEAKREKANEVLEKALQDHLFVIWSAEDVKACRPKGERLSVNDCREILDDVSHHHDCTIGIARDVLRDAAWQFCQERKNAKEREEKNAG